MPGALAVLWKLVRDEKAEGKIGTIKKMDQVFGLELLKEEIVDVPSDVEKLARERQRARDDKDWEMSDEIRGQILEKGWIIKDRKEGYELETINS
jgi:cysteinyl-tRNA synthetase